LGEGAVVEPVTAARCAGGLPVTARQNGALVLPLAAQVCTKQGLQKLHKERVNEEPRLALKWFIFQHYKDIDVWSQPSWVYKIIPHSTID